MIMKQQYSNEILKRVAIVMELMNEEKLRQKSNEVNLHKIKMLDLQIELAELELKQRTNQARILDLEIELAELELKRTGLMIQMLEEKKRRFTNKGGRR